MGKLDGKVAVITGATGGIGSAIARQFGAEGAKLILGGRRKERADDFLAELHQSGVEAEFVLGDVKSDDYADRLAARAREKYGHVDSLVLNAGVVSWAKVCDITLEQYDDMMNTNVRASWLCVKAFHDLLSEGAAVVVTASVSSFIIFPEEGVYCMTKAAIIQMVRALALELADRGIRVNALCPGAVGGDGMTQNLLDISDDPQAVTDEIVAATPLGKIGTLDEIASGAVFLASGDASFVTGTSLVIDGGMMIPRV
jgi:NAD(P)-dependent dehydrogenase (short-subunit alcohol dehydrogenase family)